MGKIDFEPIVVKKPKIDFQAAGDPGQPPIAAIGNPDGPTPDDPAQGVSDSLKAFGNGAANGATMGYLPQLQALAAGPITKGLDLITGQNQYADLPNYVDRRDAMIKEQDAMKKSNPYAYGGGQLAGGIGSAVVLPGGALKGASTLAKIGMGATTGGAYGFAANPGDTKGVVDPLQMHDRVDNAETGAVIGGAIPGAGALASEYAPTLKSLAARQAFKAIGAMTKDYRVASDKELIEPLGQYAMDNSIVTAGDTVGKIAKKANDQQAAAGTRLGALYDAAKKKIAGQAPVVEPGQLELPGQFDDLQRTAEKNVPVTLNGPDALPKALPPELTGEAQANKLLSQPGEANFPGQSETAARVGKKVTDRLQEAAQTEFDAANAQQHLASRPIVTSPVTDVEGLPGQTEMLLDGGKTPLMKSPSQISMDEAGFNPIRDKAEIMAKARADLGDHPDAEAGLQKLSDYLDSRGKAYGDQTLDPGAANKIKTAMDQKINYSRDPLKKEPGSEIAFRSARDFLSDKIANHVDTIGKLTGDSDLAAQLAKANHDYAMTSKIADIANNRAGQLSAHNLLGLSDITAGTGAAAVGGIASALAGHSSLLGVGTGLGVAGASKLGKVYGNPIMARGAGAVANKLENGMTYNPWVSAAVANQTKGN